MRVERIGDATLYLGDCLEILPTLEKVDAVITDPPFLGLTGGMTFLKGGVALPGIVPTHESVGDYWDANLDWMLPAWSICNGPFCVFCSYHSIADVRQAIPKKPVALFTWHKRNSPCHPGNFPRWTDEHIWAWQNGGVADWRVFTSTLIDEPKPTAGCMATERLLIPNTVRAAHPTQKPVAVMARFVEVASGVVLDPFMGVGTTGVACIEQGRKFIGIEINERYFDLACERIRQAQAQGKLFEPTVAEQLRLVA